MPHCGLNRSRRGDPLSRLLPGADGRYVPIGRGIPIDTSVPMLISLHLVKERHEVHDVLATEAIEEFGGHE